MRNLPAIKSSQGEIPTLSNLTNHLSHSQSIRSNPLLVLKDGGLADPKENRLRKRFFGSFDLFESQEDQDTGIITSNNEEKLKIPTDVIAVSSSSPSPSPSPNDQSLLSSPPSDAVVIKPSSTQLPMSDSQRFQSINVPDTSNQSDDGRSPRESRLREHEVLILAHEDEEIPGAWDIDGEGEDFHSEDKRMKATAREEKIESVPEMTNPTINTLEGFWDDSFGSSKGEAGVKERREEDDGLHVGGKGERKERMDLKEHDLRVQTWRQTVQTTSSFITLMTTQQQPESNQNPSDSPPAPRRTLLRPTLDLTTNAKFSTVRSRSRSVLASGVPRHYFDKSKKEWIPLPLPSEEDEDEVETEVMNDDEDGNNGEGLGLSLQSLEEGINNNPTVDLDLDPPQTTFNHKRDDRSEQHSFVRPHPRVTRQYQRKKRKRHGITTSTYHFKGNNNKICGTHSSNPNSDFGNDASTSRRRKYNTRYYIHRKVIGKGKQDRDRTKMRKSPRKAHALALET